MVHAVGDLMPSASDNTVLAHAHQHSLWLLTFDRDYGELVFAGKAPAPPAILYLRQDPFPMARFAATLLEALKNMEVLRGHLVVIDGRRIRRRPLPRS